VGGAAWSAHTLAKALLQRGHDVTAVVPMLAATPRSAAMLWQEMVQDVPTVRRSYHAPRLPLLQNYCRHERLWHPLADVLTDLACRQHNDQPLLIHAQHVQTTPPAVLAGQRMQVPVVVTVRDHWPWDYFATGLHGNRFPYRVGYRLLQRWASLATDLPARLGALRGALLLPGLPYMLAHMSCRAAFLARASAVIAVSRYIAHRLIGIVPPERLHVIPNMVDIDNVQRIAAAPPETPLQGPFLLYIGKLEYNKGAALLPAIFRALRGEELPPLLVAGSGALRASLERDLKALGVRVRFLEWVVHDELLRLLARCTLLLFPSAWGEPLSRVLLEASAAGAPILAMPTGGTPDIISDSVNGALAASPQQFARRLRDLLHDDEQRRRLGEEARQVARERFAVQAVLPRIEALYRQL
jgi:glycosyltransferase involved in cell wall biosynthesis